MTEQDAINDLQTILAAYDATVPFPEFAQSYLQEHPSKYDLSTVIKFIMPPNPVSVLSEDELDRLASNWEIPVTITIKGQKYRGAIWLVEGED